MAQKLSSAAKAAKAVRDKKFAMTDERTAKKAENQRLRKGKFALLSRKYSQAYVKRWMEKHDYDHKCSCWKTIKANRGNGGKGTKEEGKRKYSYK